MFKPHEDCALSKAKQWAINKMTVPWSKMSGEKLFFVISSPSTPTFGSKQHWLLILDNSSEFIWTFFLKDESNQGDIVVGVIKNLENE